jgi:hypothetical protein
MRQRRRRAKLNVTREVAFVRADWALFLHPDRLPQKAGCPKDRLRAMILKELADNGLDAGAKVTVDQLDLDTWVVTDDGPGLDREQVVRLFAVNRAMTSTKLVRRPTRGAIGNGLRVVTGGVLASGGRLQVESRGARYLLDVDRGSGETVVIEEGGSDIDTGTRVTVAFGPALPPGPDDGWMARLALRCAGPAARPMRSHPSWYEPAVFAELVAAAEPGTTVGEIAALMGVQLDDLRPTAEANLSSLQSRAGAHPSSYHLVPTAFPAAMPGSTVMPGLPQSWRKCGPGPPAAHPRAVAGR